MDKGFETILKGCFMVYNKIVPICCSTSSKGKFNQYLALIKEKEGKCFQMQNK